MHEVSYKQGVAITHFGNTCYFKTFHLLENIIIVHHIKCLKIYLVKPLKIKLLCLLRIVSLIKSVLCKTYKQLQINKCQSVIFSWLYI